MLTRRSMMLASIAAGVIMNNRTASAKAAQPATPVNFDVPAGACDCHTHIHPDPAKFPFFAGRVYTPELASPEEMTALHKALRMERVVIVTPSIYGTDNSATLFGMAARGPTARGVAVIDDKTSESDLDLMGKAGIRGVRLNLATGGVNDPSVARPRFTAAVERMKARGWHVQLYTNLAMITAVKDLVMASPVPVVFDHFGGAQAALGVEQPGFADLVDLVKSGKAYVKISGAYRASKLGPDYADCIPLAQALIAANADRIVWGTDWPHPDSVTPARQADHRRDAAVPDRRRAAVEPASGVGAGCCDPQEDPGRQPGAALRVLKPGARHRGPLKSERVAVASAQPVAGLAQAAEREQVKSRDRSRCGRGRAAQSPDDVVRPGIRQQAAEPADLGPQRAHGIADAAAEREFCQCRRRGRTGKADDDRKIDAGAIEFSDPLQDRRALEAELRDDIDRAFRSAVPSRANRLQPFHARPAVRGTDGPRDDRPR